MNEEERKSLIDGIKAVITEKAKETDVVLKQVQTDIDKYGKAQEGTKDAVAKLTEENQKLFGRLNELEQKFATEGTGSRHGRVKAIGDVVVEDEGFKAWAAKNAGAGKSTSPAVKVKMITSLSDSGSAGIFSDRIPGVVQEPLRQFTIRSLLDNGRTSSNLIEWVREDVFTNEADVVSEGSQKPESDITFEQVDVPVRTIAHWVHATRQVLADFPQLASIINGRLRYGLMIAEETELLLGSGTAPHLLGLIPQATDYNTALNRPGDTFIDVLRHAILQVRLAYYPATGIVLTPTDWHNIELTKDNENRYLMANPQGTMPAMLWGRPVVESDGMPNDQFLVGAFKLAATVFDREDAQIFVSTEDRDNFIKNLVTILCEERLALAVSRPAAFVHGSFPADSTT